MLWQVGSTNLHILGTVHWTDQPLTQDEATEAAFDAAEVVAFEEDLRIQPPQQDGRYRVGALRDHIDPDLYAAAERMFIELECGRAEDFAALRPWWAALSLQGRLLARHGLTADNGADQVYQRRSVAAGKQLFFLGPAGDGLSAFKRGPAEEQAAMLRNLVNEPDQAVADLRAILVAWRAREPERMLEITAKGAKATPTIYRAGLQKRNALWAPKLVRLAKSGRRALAVVGCLHMVGAGSLPELLAAKGLECAFA